VSEYSWYVKQIWFGVEGPKPDVPMLGIIKRSGQCKALGHFCHVKISVNGKRVWASGAEDRIFYMHLVEWHDIGSYVPRDMIPALGWCKGGNCYAFLHEGKIVEAGREGTLHEIGEDLWQDEWREDPKTLIQRGVCLCNRPRIALLDEVLEEDQYMPHAPKPRVLVPFGRFNPESCEFVGLEGVQEIWNGPPPPWCKQVVQVLSSPQNKGWIHLKKNEMTTLWSRR
jgi:hypothetical protein